jgi:hypothetical protein
VSGTLELFDFLSSKIQDIGRKHKWSWIDLQQDPQMDPQTAHEVADPWRVETFELEEECGQRHRQVITSLQLK